MSPAGGGAVGQPGGFFGAEASAPDGGGGGGAGGVGVGGAPLASCAVTPASPWVAGGQPWIAEHSLAESSPASPAGARAPSSTVSVRPLQAPSAKHAIVVVMARVKSLTIAGSSRRMTFRLCEARASFEATTCVALQWLLCFAHVYP
jgi:hypothetical protein